jgi:uncharacterized protein YlxW (UPF0749 family)
MTDEQPDQPATPEPAADASTADHGAASPESPTSPSEPEVAASASEPEPEVAASEPEPEVAASEPEPEASEPVSEVESPEPEAASPVSAEASPADEDVSPPDVAADGDTVATQGWRRVLTGLLQPRFTAASAVIALLIGLLGFALIAQVKTNDSSSTLSSDRPDDLVRILSDLDSRKDRLNTEITNLQETQRQLSSGAEGKQAALAAARQRADELGILAGTLPAEGPGIVIDLDPTRTPIDATVVLDAVEELRGAGAEAMQISGTNGSTVRIVASTWFVDGTSGIVVSGTPMSGILTITVIGDPQTMQTALTIPGGVDDTVQQNGGTVHVQQPGTVRVTALAPQSPMKYAHPVS